MPKPILTAEILKQYNSAKHAIQLFQKYYPNGITKWNLEEQIKFLKTPLVWYLGLFWNKGLLENISMAGADLTKINLVNAGIIEANLAGANLTEANLAGANFTEANLTGADLTGANLRNTYFWNANLTGANLTGVDIRYCSFRNTTFHKTILKNAKFNPKILYMYFLKR